MAKFKCNFVNDVATFIAILFCVGAVWEYRNLHERYVELAETQTERIHAATESQSGLISDLQEKLTETNRIADRRLELLTTMNQTQEITLTALRKTEQALNEVKAELKKYRQIPAKQAEKKR